jgi:hypothetical protein
MLSFHYSGTCQSRRRDLGDNRTTEKECLITYHVLTSIETKFPYQNRPAATKKAAPVSERPFSLSSQSEPGEPAPGNFRPTIIEGQRITL